MMTPAELVQRILWSGGWYTLATLAKSADLDEGVTEQALEHLIAQGAVETIDALQHDSGFAMYKRAAVAEFDE